jgi:hypothetical protein
MPVDDSCFSLQPNAWTAQKFELALVAESHPYQWLLWLLIDHGSQLQRPLGHADPN